MEVTGNIYIIEPEDSFKRVHKSIIENKNIDCLTLGVYTKIIVLGAKWKLNIKGLSTHLGLSDAKIRKSISLLEQEGYVVRTAVRGEGGKFFGWNYQILPTPADEDKRSSAGKPTLQKTDTRLNRQDGEPTTPSTDMSESGQDNNNRPNKIIDLNNNKTKRNNELSNDNSKPTYLLSDKIEKQIAETDKALVYPDTFTEECRLLWENLRREPKWRKKSASALQTSLNKLAKYPSGFQIVMMSNSLEKGWQGIEYNNTQEEYEKWKRRQMASINPNDKRELEQLEIAKRIERLYGK